jgi:hypothetical protein
MATNRRDPGVVGVGRSAGRAAQWVVAIVLPIAIGGVVGGAVGGCVTAVLIIPWLDHLLRRGERRPERPGPAAVGIVVVEHAPVAVQPERAEDATANKAA